MTDFADYIVFVDESGDQSLSSIDPEFPVFCLSFCIVAKADYIGAVVPAVQVFKFKYWGHDAVILHEHEIRKTIGDFAFLRADRGLREAFMSDLSHLMSAAHRSAIFADRPRWVLEDFDRQHGAGVLVTEQDRLLVSLLRPNRFMDFVRRFLFFDKHTGKIAARYQQVQGVKAIITQVSKIRPDGSREGGQAR